MENVFENKVSGKIWNTALYIRLSREDGDKMESESVKSQREMLRNFLLKNPDLKLYDEYIDDGYTGTNFNRDSFERMFNDIRANKVDCVIVKDLSRLGRNHIETSKYIEIVFPMLKVRFIAINDQIDSFLNPQSINNVIVPFKNLLNDEYCRDISMKIRSSLTIKRENGQYIGSFACYGYIKDPNDKHKLIIDEEAADNVRMIYKMFLEGATIRSIAIYMNDNNYLTPSEYKRSKGYKDRHFSTTGKPKWDSIGIKRILTNQMYVGDMVQKQAEIVSYKVKICRKVDKVKRIIVPNTHEAIISREDFEKVQSLLARDTRVCTSTKQLDLLSGFCKCGDCRRGMNKKHIHQPYKEYYYYICSTFKKSGRKACTKHAVQVDKIKEAVFAVIKQYINIAITMDNLIDFINRSEERTKETTKIDKMLKSKYAERDDINRLLEDLYPDWKKGFITQDMYLSMKDKYSQKKEEILSAIENLILQKEAIKNGLTTENRFIENFKKYQNITELTRDVVVELINNIYIYEGGKIEVEVKFRDEYMNALQYIELNRQVYIQEKKYQQAQIALSM